MKLVNIFQDFYTATGRLSTFNSLLVVPDGEAPPGENEINMKQLYDLFKIRIMTGLFLYHFLDFYFIILKIQI